MKKYKVMKTYLPVGERGDTVELEQDAFTTSMLAQEIIQELKIEAPRETKKRRPTNKG